MERAPGAVRASTRLPLLAGFAALVVTGAIAKPARSEEALTLTQALLLGRQRSPAVAAARAHAASAEANVDEVAAAYYPTLSANLSATGGALHDLQPTSPPVAAGHPLLYVYNNASLAGAAGGSARWTLYDFGRTAASVRAARALRDGSIAGVGVTELGVAGDVAGAFVTLYYREQLCAVIQATLTAREELVALAHGMAAEGLAPPLEEIRAAARAETARSQLADAEAGARDARAFLASLLGLPAESPLRIAPPRLPEPSADLAAARIAADALPAVASAEADLDTKIAAADAARARYRPVVSLAVDGSYRFTQSKGSVGGLPVDPPFPLNTANVTAAVSLAVPIFDASIAPNLLGAELDVATSSARVDQARRDARNEATRAVIGAAGTAARVAHARKAAEAAAGVLEIVQARYVRGLSSPLDLIEAESADSAARVAGVQAEFDHALAVLRVLAATGRPVSEVPP